MTPTAQQPELMAPAGDWDSLRAAVANGADAVYFGLSNYNARHRAANFTRDELPRVMDYLRGHNVRGYLTFNTLIFSDELPEAMEFIASIAAARVDAVIVQDLGLAQLIRAAAPGLVLHGSTQMTLTDARGIEVVKRLGVQRVVLARELSADEIARIGREAQIPVEAFVHGALCVSYSGQCLTSESLGGRSANRGQCAQACRLPYDLIVDGEQHNMGERAYLLSPQDLAAHDLVQRLLDAGVRCFKIEGRLKGAHYVAAATRAYRTALDAAIELRPFRLEDQQRADLEQSFSRGFSHGFLDGVNHQALVPGLFPKNRGVLIGTVRRILPHGVLVRLTGTLKPGDGVVFDEGHPEQDEQGGRVFVVRPQGKDEYEIEMGRGDVNFSSIAVGARVWKTDDPAVRRRLEVTFSRDRIVRKTPLDAMLHAAVDQPLRLRLSDASHEVEVTSGSPAQLAKKHAASVEMVRQQLSRLGDTPFELQDVQLTGDGAAMVPMSVLNDMRRKAVASLLALREPPAVPVDLDALRRLREAAHAPRAPAHAEATLSVLVRTSAQLDAVIAHPARHRLSMVYCDFEDVRRHRHAVEALHDAGLPVALATVRIVKPGEDGLLRQIADCVPDAILVRNLSALAFYREHAPNVPLLGDYSLNVANEITASILLDAGLTRLTASYDLNLAQLAAMLARSDAGRFEVVLHQHMPMFHMEHCVFAAALSTGRDYRDCGRPCDRHAVDLRDRTGVRHALIPDVGCRNTVYNGTPQSAGRYLPRLRDMGARHFRIEMLREDAQQAAKLIESYLALLDGRSAKGPITRGMRVLDQLGVTAGTLDFE